MAYDIGIQGEDFAAQEEAFLRRYDLACARGVPSEATRAIAAAMQRNLFLAAPSSPEDPAFELEHPLRLFSTDDERFLRDYFAHGNWAFREGVVIDDLAFVQQVDGGDEWAVFKRDFDGRRWSSYDMPFGSFESIGMCAIARDGEGEGFQHLVALLQMATQDQCARLDYDDGRVAAVRWEPAHRRINTRTGDALRVWTGNDLAGHLAVSVAELPDGAGVAELYPRGSIDKRHFDGFLEAMDLLSWGYPISVPNDSVPSGSHGYRFTLRAADPIGAARCAQALVSHAALYGKGDGPRSTLSVAISDAARINALLRQARLDTSWVMPDQDVAAGLISRSGIADLAEALRLARRQGLAPEDEAEGMGLLDDWTRGRRQAVDRGDAYAWHADLGDGAALFDATPAR